MVHLGADKGCNEKLTCTCVNMDVTASSTYGTLFIYAAKTTLKIIWQISTHWSEVEGLINIYRLLLHLT